MLGGRSGRCLSILWTVTLIIFNSLGSTIRPLVEQSLDVVRGIAADGCVHQEQTFHNSTKTREGINCDAIDPTSTAHSERDKLAHSICLETELV